MPLDHILSNTNNDWGENFIRQQADFLKRVHKLATDRLVCAAAANKRHYDRRAMASSLPIGSRVLTKQCAFKERHKLQDHFSEEQYIVVKCNIDQDLYEVRPALGGPTKWLNRKMLILDPRGDHMKSGEPLGDLFDTSCLHSDIDASSSSDSDEELVMVFPKDLVSVPLGTGPIVGNCAKPDSVGMNVSLTLPLHRGYVGQSV